MAYLVINLLSLFQGHPYTLICSKKALIAIQWLKNAKVTNRIHETKVTLITWSLWQGKKHFVCHINDNKVGGKCLSPKVTG